MTFSPSLDSKQKALEVNLNNNIYGTFAEIGAGQEVARNFFRAGGAAGTIAKSISAYDMTVSDIIYGKSGRYVSEERLQMMLDKEFDQLTSRLSEVRSEDTCFFAFADTVAAKGYNSKKPAHGWLGLKFQLSPNQEASKVVIHVRMLDRENIQQQEVLGIIGVNLIHSCYFCDGKNENFLPSLMDNLTSERIEIDMIRVEGPAFHGIDSRLLSLELVRNNLCEAVMFDPQGRVIQASDELYKKSIMVLRGSYRPPTLVNLDMLEKGFKKFSDSLSKEEQDKILVLPEISMNRLYERGEVDHDDFLARVDLLAALGHTVLITNFENFYELSQFLDQFSKSSRAIVTGIYNLEQTFDEKRYQDKPSGLLGAIGELFGHHCKLYIYPACDEDNPGSMKTLASVREKSHLKTLITYLESKGYMESMEDYNASVSHIWSRTVLKMIQEGSEGWEEMVPEVVRDIVKSKGLFGYKK
jgi:hypothetical protein